MIPQKLLVLTLGALFLAGAAGPSLAQEKKMEKPAAKAKTAEGAVKSVTDTTLVVEGKDKREWSFAIGGKVAESARKLKVGDTVIVSYTEDGGGMTATKVAGAKAPKRAANPCAAKK